MSHPGQPDIGPELVAMLPRLRRFAMVLARSRDAADDLVQASLERALGRSSQWEPGTRLDRWMFRIIKTVWLNSRRSAKIRHTEPLEDHADSMVEDGARAAEARLSLSEVRVAFSRLPPEQQQPLLLVCVEGYTYAEAAEFLGVPMGTVISRLVRGRAALMSAVSADEPSNVTLFRQKRTPS